MRIALALLGGFVLVAPPAHGRVMLTALLGADLADSGAAGTPLRIAERKPDRPRGWSRRAPIQAQRKPREPRNDINATLEAMAIAKVGFSIPASSSAPGKNQ